MKAMTTQFEGLADRAGFNANVRHIKSTLGILDRVSTKENLADVLAGLSGEGSLSKDQLPAIVSMVLGDKFGYRPFAANLRGVTTDLPSVAEEMSKWNGVDIVVVYHHPDLGVIVINPKNKAQMTAIDRVNRSELMTVWAGRFAKEGEGSLLEAAAKACIDLFSGKAVKAKLEFLKGDCAYRQPVVAGEKPTKSATKAPASKVAPKKSVVRPSAKKAGAPTATVEAPPPEPEHKPAVEAERAIKPGSKMTPMYSVPVTNELFHNGNVEAWKRIIASYNSKHPDLAVLVYYDGERITNLNALFTWGKVKHGSTIQFAVAGDTIADVAKLQRYLAQGASRMYEAFLRGPVNSVMVLF